MLFHFFHAVRTVRLVDFLYHTERGSNLFFQPFQRLIHVDGYDDETLAELADENNERNIPDIAPETDFDDEGYEKYREETGLPKIRR